MQIPEVVILRLPVYLRALRAIDRDGGEVISSRGLGEYLQITPAQIRKDLSYFGRFGRQGTGYNVKRLLNELRQILGLDREWTACLIGLGRLGRAIVGYPGFTPEGFRIVAIFDVNPKLVGKGLRKNLKVQPMSELCGTILEHQIDIGIVAVPAAQAQGVISQLIACGVKAILNYAPIAPQVPEGVKVRNIDPVLSLQSMTYHLRILREGKQTAVARGNWTTPLRGRR